MKKNLFLLVLTCMVMANTAWGQVEELSEKDMYAEQYIYEIRDNWVNTPLQVENLFPKAQIRNFAKAFCSQYQQYKPNVAMVDYLKKPGEYDWDEKHYYVEDDPRNGYIKSDLLGQFDFMTAMCYWRRANKHQLVGVLMQIGHEGERSDAVMLFYDYDPETQVMTPDTEVYQTVVNIVKKHRGDMFVRLPQEGKDIEVSTVVWSEEDDFIFDDFLLHWTGDSFVEKAASSSY